MPRKALLKAAFCAISSRLSRASLSLALRASCRISRTCSARCAICLSLTSLMPEQKLATSTPWPNGVSIRSALPNWESCDDGVGVEDFSNAVEGDALETSLSGGMAVDGEEAGGSRTEEKSDASHVLNGFFWKRKHGLSPQKREDMQW